MTKSIKSILLFSLGALILGASWGCSESNPQEGEASKYPKKKALTPEEARSLESKAAGHYGPPPSTARTEAGGKPAAPSGDGK